MKRAVCLSIPFLLLSLTILSTAVSAGEWLVGPEYDSTIIYDDNVNDNFVTNDFIRYTGSLNSTERNYTLYFKTRSSPVYHDAVGIVKNGYFVSSTPRDLLIGQTTPADWRVELSDYADLSSAYSSITYADQYGNTGLIDLVYDYQFTSLKERLVVKSLDAISPYCNASQTMVFPSKIRAYRTDNFTAGSGMRVEFNHINVPENYNLSNMDGPLDLLDGEYNVVYSMQRPVMYDSAGNGLELNYSLEMLRLGDMQVNIEVPCGFFVDATYPVFIDPSWITGTVTPGYAYDVQVVDLKYNFSISNVTTLVSSSHDWGGSSSPATNTICSLGTMQVCTTCTSGGTCSGCSNGAAWLWLNQSGAVRTGSNLWYLGAGSGDHCDSCVTTWSTITPTVARYVRLSNTNWDNAARQCNRHLNNTGSNGPIQTYVTDAQVPNVTLVAPVDLLSNVSSVAPVPFMFNATAVDYSMANMTLVVWTSGGSVYMTNTTVVSGSSPNVTFSLPMAAGVNYKWNVYACDLVNNCAYAPANRTLTILYDTGVACSTGGQCNSGNCVDGACCTTTSCSSCMSCNVAGHAGGCYNVPYGQNHASDCNTNNCGKGTCTGGYCYQETAGQGTGCGSSSGDYDVQGLWNDGTWAQDDGTYLLNSSWNYEIPSGASNNNSFLMIAYHRSGATPGAHVYANITIPDACRSFGFHIFSITMASDGFGENMNITCTQSGGSQVHIFGDRLVGQTHSLVEEAMWWYNGVAQCDWYISGERECNPCRTCDGATSTSCVSLPDNTQDDVGSYICNGICKKCYGGLCVNQAVEDLFSHCGTNNCGNGMCDGEICYQEFANVSTACGGVNTGSYSESHGWNDGNWTTSGASTTQYWNYTKPGSALSPSFIQIGYYGGGVWYENMTFPSSNITIPSDCWAQNPLQFKSNNTTPPLSIGHSRAWYCWNGSSWRQILSQGSVDWGIAFIEEAMWWLTEAGTGACGHLTTGEGNCGACQSCFGATSSSCVNMPSNTQDTQGVNLCDATCMKCSSGSCTYQSDLQDLFSQCGGVTCTDPPSYYWGWVGNTCYFMNDVSDSACNGAGSCRGASYYCPSSSQGDATNVMCGCDAAGMAGTCTGTSIGTCNNSMCYATPSATDVHIDPSPAFDTDDLTCLYTFVDPWGHDENTTQRQFRWYRGGSLLSDLNNRETIGEGNTTTGEAWMCSVSVANLHNQSGFFNSTEVVLGDDIAPYNTTSPTISALTQCSENGSSTVVINITDDASDIGSAYVEVVTPSDTLNLTMDCSAGKPSECTRVLTGYSTSFETTKIYFTDSSNNWAYVDFPNIVDVHTCTISYGAGGGGGGAVETVYFRVYPRQATTKGDHPTDAIIVGDQSLKYTIVPKMSNTQIQVFVQPATFKDNANNVLNSTDFFKVDPIGSIRMNKDNISMTIYCDIPNQYRFQPFGLFNTSIVVKKEGAKFQESIAVTCESKEHFEGAGSLSSILNQPIEYLGITIGEIWFIAILAIVVVTYRSSIKKKTRSPSRY